MPATERSFARGTRRGVRALQTLGDELREKRVGAGLTQARVAAAVHMSRSWYSRVEAAKVGNLSIVDASRLATGLGLELSVRLYPGADPLRDVAHAKRLRMLLQHVKPPLRYRTDVPLPQRPDRPTELRAWDALILSPDGRTGVEMEMRIRDLQETIRRHAMKRRDDPVDTFLMVLADTPANRRVIADYGALLPDLPRLRTSRVLRTLRSGARPPTGLVLL